MNDWIIIILLFLLGGSTDFFASKKIKNSRIRSFVALSVWFVIGIIFLILWYIRQ